MDPVQPIPNPSPRLIATEETTPLPPPPAAPADLSAPVPTPQIASKPKKRWGKGALVGGLLALVLLVGGLEAGVYLNRQKRRAAAEAKYTELGILPANVSDLSLSVWWRHPSAESGCAVATNLSTGRTQKKCDNRKSPTHLITIEGLTPKTQYKLVALHGKKEIGLSPFWGQGIWTYPRAPTSVAPVNGRVVSADGKPLSEGTVFIAPNLSDRLYIPVAVLTDKNGAFTIIPPPLGNRADAYFVEVTDKDGNKVLETSLNKDLVKSPFTITVNRQ